MTKRAECPICKRMIALRKNGALRGHGSGMRDYTASWCPGSSQPPLNGITMTTDIRKQDRSVTTTKNPLAWFEDFLGEPRL